MRRRWSSEQLEPWGLNSRPGTRAGQDLRASSLTLGCPRRRWPVPFASRFRRVSGVTAHKNSQHQGCFHMRKQKGELGWLPG